MTTPTPALTAGAPADGPGQQAVTGGALAAFLSAQEANLAGAGDEVEPDAAPAAEPAPGPAAPGAEGEPEPADQFAGLSREEAVARARGLAGEVSRLRPAEREARRTVEVLQGRLVALLERLESAPPAAPAAEQPPAPPDREEDPLGYLLYKVEQLEAATRQGGAQTAEQRMQAAVVEAVQTADRYVAQFAAATPDYDPVVRAGLARAEEVAAEAHPDATPQEIQAGMTRYIHQLKLAELAAGRNPGERIYRLAMSYLAGSAPAAAGQPNQVVNGGHRAGVPPSIAGVPGSSAGAAAATLADRIRVMSDEEFDAEMGDVDARTVDPRTLFGDKVKTR